MLLLLHLKFIAFVNPLPVQFHQQHLADLATFGTNVAVGGFVVINNPSHLGIRIWRSLTNFEAD